MLRTELVYAEEGITIPYPPIPREGESSNHGFIDVRGRPDLAATIPEASESEALRRILVELAQPSSLFATVGCALGAYEVPESEADIRYRCGGYVHLFFIDHSERWEFDYENIITDTRDFKSSKAENYKWFIRYTIMDILLEADDMEDTIPSLQIWFHCADHSPEAALSSREVLIDTIREALALFHPRKRTRPAI
ncbi:hypothetical protein [Inquilinus limosus]|uniref:hypothetical protein n=1 Tax=Inquilinus limosus TaxID=171674 RepID=UPI00047A1ADC|nr:hypothetical protein [Inquilinus limosus]